MENLTKNNFEDKMKKNIVFVDFWASWCGPCRAFAPIFEEVAGKFQGKAEFLKCNVDDERNIALKNGIMSIPCVLVFKEGNVVDKSLGLLPVESFVSFVEKNLK